MCQVWCSSMQGIYAQLKGAICHGYMCIVLYVYRSAMTCAKFAVVVLQACMLNWGISICHGYMCIVLYIKLIWYNGFAEIYARSGMRCAKCGVAVLKSSMLHWGVSICHGYMCIVLYMKPIWCNGFAEIYV